MTNYLNENDRLFKHVEPVLQDIANKTEDAALAMEVGALTVIGLLGESLADTRMEIARIAEEYDEDAGALTNGFDSIVETIFGILQPRVDALRDAVLTAQGVKVEEEPEVTVSDVLGHHAIGPSR